MPAIVTIETASEEAMGTLFNGHFSEYLTATESLAFTEEAEALFNEGTESDTFAARTLLVLAIAAGRAAAVIRHIRNGFRFDIEAMLLLSRQYNEMLMGFDIMNEATYQTARIRAKAIASQFRHEFPELRI